MRVFLCKGETFVYSPVLISLSLAAIAAAQGTHPSAADGAYNLVVRYGVGDTDSFVLYVTLDYRTDADVVGAGASCMLCNVGNMALCDDGAQCLVVQLYDRICVVEGRSKPIVKQYIKIVFGLPRSLNHVYISDGVVLVERHLCTYDSRALMATETGNSKLVMIRSCPGFPVNSYERVECFLGGEPFPVNPQEGSFLFVSDWKKFTIPEDVVVIGVENMENFSMIRRQRRFFEEYLHAHGLSDKVLFVSRYPQSTDLRRWLCTISNHYLHFGDFDLAGISIFLFEFRQYLGKVRSSYLIQDDIESRLKSGSRKRYDEQCEHFKDIKSDILELQRLIELIHKERKAYDQEGYICCNHK